jgi:aryl-alcohol dehydrogenase-like predicted oxidoreductase
MLWAMLTHDAIMQIGAVFDKCVALGVSMLNSAQFYGADRANEKIIGRFTGDRADKFQARHDVSCCCDSVSLPVSDMRCVVHAQVRPESSEIWTLSGGIQVGLKVGGRGSLGGGDIQFDATPAYLKETVDTALDLLKRPVLDIVIQARQVPDTPLEDVMRCFKELVESGVHPAETLPAASPFPAAARDHARIGVWAPLLWSFTGAC